MTELAPGAPRLWPAVVVPPEAARQWAQLSVALAELPESPACAAEPEAWQRGGPRVVELCASCPVQTECAAYAIAGRENFGVWGGLTPAERRAAR